MDRTIGILDILAANKTIKISMLAELLNVSQVTLRKDLDIIEKRGIIQRTHGYVSLDDAHNIGKRLAINHSIKKRIAKAAAEIVEEGETVMIESGSCCTLFAEELALTRKNVTIITNSIFIVNYIYKPKDIKIILLGGLYQPEAQVLFGPITAKCGKLFYTDKFFLGADGYIPEHGFTDSDHLHAETVMELAKYAKNVFVLTEAAKFQRRGTYSLIQLDKLSGVFTDENIPKEAEDTLIKNNVKLYKVPSVEKKIRWQQFPGQPPFLYTEEK